jgi:DNA repair exonuclease SbcCD ATPase subunit
VVIDMRKQNKIVAIAALVLLLVSFGSSALVLGQPTIENRATRIVQIAEEASETVADLIFRVEGNETIKTKIADASLTEAFEANVSLYYQGVSKFDEADGLLGVDDFEGAISAATQALSIFREVYRSINSILVDSDVRLRHFVSAEELTEAIERSQERVDELKGLISTEAPVYKKLLDAESYLTQALEFLPDNIEDAKANLREANTLISEVCQYLKEVAQELNPQRIRDYCEGAYQYHERFRGRFGQAGNEGFDVDGFLQGFGYQNEDEFMAKFEEMIQNAEGTEKIEDALDDLEEIGRVIRQMDQSFTQEMGRYRAQHGQTASTGGFGQEGSGSGYGQGGSSSGSGYGGTGGSGQMGYGGGQ